VAHTKPVGLSAYSWAIPFFIPPKAALVRPTPPPLPTSFLGMPRLIDVEDEAHNQLLGNDFLR